MNCRDPKCETHVRREDMEIRLKGGLRWRCPTCQTWWPIKIIPQAYVIDESRLPEEFKRKEKPNE